MAVADPEHVRMHVEDVLARNRGGRGEGSRPKGWEWKAEGDVEVDVHGRMRDVERLVRCWEGLEDETHSAMAARFAAWTRSARKEDGWAAEAAVLAHAHGAWKRKESTRWMAMWRKCAHASSWWRATTAKEDVWDAWESARLELGWAKAINHVLEHMEKDAWKEAEAAEACRAWTCICAMDYPTCFPIQVEEETVPNPQETTVLSSIHEQLKRWESRRACARTLSPQAHKNALEIARRYPCTDGHEEVSGCMAVAAAASLWIPEAITPLEPEARDALEQVQAGLADGITDVLQMGQGPSRVLDRQRLEAFGGAGGVCLELAQAATPAAKQSLFQATLGYCVADTGQEVEPTLNTLYAARAASRAARLGVHGCFGPLTNGCQTMEGRSLMEFCERLAVNATRLPPGVQEHACPELLHDLLCDGHPYERDTASKVLFHMLCQRVDQGKPALPSWGEGATGKADGEAFGLSLAGVIREELDHAKEDRAWAAERFARVLVRVALYVDLHTHNRSFLEETPDEALIVQAEVYLSGVNWLKACGAMDEGAAAVLCQGLLDTLCTWKKKDAVSGKHIGLSNAKALLNGSVFVYRTALDCFPIRLLAMLLEALPAGNGAGPLDPLRAAMLLMLMGRCSKVDSRTMPIAKLGSSTIYKLLDDPDAQVGYYAAMYFLRRFVQQKPDEFNAALARVTERVREKGEDPEILENPYNLMIRMKEIGIDMTN